MSKHLSHMYIFTVIVVPKNVYMYTMYIHPNFSWHTNEVKFLLVPKSTGFCTAFRKEKPTIEIQNVIIIII